jgi:hypothetical protein
MALGRVEKRLGKEDNPAHRNECCPQGGPENINLKALNRIEGWEKYRF